MLTNNTVAAATIVAALTPENGKYFSIANLATYANKVTRLGRSVSIYDPTLGDTAAFILYYDNGPDLFMTMAWTHPSRRRAGFAERLFRGLIRSTQKSIRLQVHPDNPGRRLYERLGFAETCADGDVITMIRAPRIAIMQPYLFPYLGYFHLAEASDLFVFYDDVHWIKQGWINRNALLASGDRQLFTVPTSGASPNVLIRDVGINLDERWIRKFRKTLDILYARAPHRKSVTDLVLGVLTDCAQGSAADLAISSISEVYQYLGQPFRWVKSSEVSPHTRGLDRDDRLVRVILELGYKDYVNASGGKSMYNKAQFLAQGVNLNFIDSDLPEYSQGPGAFVRGLSIIDVLMWNDPEITKSQLDAFRLS